MTIDFIYITFGFHVKKELVLKIFGYTWEKMPEERKDEFEQETGHRGDDGEDSHTEMVEWWFKQATETEGGYVFEYRFSVGDTGYICRSYSHDVTDKDERKNEVFVVGVEMVEVNCFEGTAVYHEKNGARQIGNLVRDKDWIEAISASEELNAYSGCDGDGTYPADSFGGHISPMTYVTTNDCGCCS